MGLTIPGTSAKDFADASAQQWLRAGMQLGHPSPLLPPTLPARLLLRAQWACRPPVEAMAVAEAMLFHTLTESYPALLIEDTDVFG